MGWPTQLENHVPEGHRAIPEWAPGSSGGRIEAALRERRVEGQFLEIGRLDLEPSLIGRAGRHLQGEAKPNKVPLGIPPGQVPFERAETVLGRALKCLLERGGLGALQDL